MRRARPMSAYAVAMCAIFATATLATPVLAGQIEVAPGLRVTRTTFDAPASEQPFYGFATPTAEQRAVNDKFVTDLTAAAGSREKAFDAATQRGWAAITKSNFSEAAKRFNQAWLLDPDRSAIYHGFALIVAGRFNNAAFAEELFQIAQKRNQPSKALNADYGRFLLLAKRAADARPVLEQGVKDAPDFPDAWSNLGFARLETGDKAGACVAAAEAGTRKPPLNIMADIVLLKRQANCT